MARSATDLMRTGAVSTKAYNSYLATTGTRVPAKMAKFDGRRKDEGGVREKATLGGGQINAPKLQSLGNPTRASGKPSTKKGRAAGMPPAGRSFDPQGGRVDRVSQPRRNQIDAEQGPTFPAGGIATGKPSTKTGNTRMKGPIRRAGGIGTQYGGPSRRMAEGG